MSMSMFNVNLFYLGQLKVGYPGFECKAGSGTVAGYRDCGRVTAEPACPGQWQLNV